MPPLILAGDFGGGGAFLALGMVSATLEAARSGKGQVVDAAIVDGALNLMAYVYGNLQGGIWNHERQANLIDGAAAFDIGQVEAGEADRSFDLGVADRLTDGEPHHGLAVADEASFGAELPHADATRPSVSAATARYRGENFIMASA